MAKSCRFFGVLNDVMLKLDLYDDEIVFNHDCDSCEIECLCLLNMERWRYKIGYGNVSLDGFLRFYDKNDIDQFMFCDQPWIPSHGLPLKVGENYRIPKLLAWNCMNWI